MSTSGPTTDVDTGLVVPMSVGSFVGRIWKIGSDEDSAASVEVASTIVDVASEEVPSTGVKFSTVVVVGPSSSLSAALSSAVNPLRKLKSVSFN